VGAVAWLPAGDRAAVHRARLQSGDSTIFRAVRIGFVFVCVTMLWIFFKLPNFDHAIGYLSGMFTPSTNPNPPKLFYNLALLYSLPVIIQHLVSRSLFERTLRGAEPYLYGSMAALMYLEAGPETSFIYFFSFECQHATNIGGSLVCKMWS
jgi:alginate O-acetyltransferase complex protein AlgI